MVVRSGDQYSPNELFLRQLVDREPVDNFSNFAPYDI
jgi:hypothetical protein